MSRNKIIRLKSWRAMQSMNSKVYSALRGKDILIIGLLLNGFMLCKPKKDTVSKLKLSGMYIAM